MLKKAKGAPRATVDRASALVDAVRPLVTRALNDPELHDALRRAFATGREVSDELGGKPPAEAARKLADDRKLRRKVETSATDLQKAVSSLVEKPKRRGRLRRLTTVVAVVGAGAGAALVLVRRLRGGNGDEAGGPDGGGPA